MSVRQTPESGLRIDRIGVIRETTTGQTPTDPAWEYHSDNYINFNWAPSPDPERRDGLGTPDAVDHDVGNQEHELVVAYHQQRPWVDGSGNPDGFVGDAALRDSANQIPNTHSLLAREFRPKSPDDPTTVDGARTYTIMKGGYPNVSIEADPETGEPIPTELTYMAEKIRSVEILQPASSSLVVAQSTSADDTTQTLSIEDEGAGTTDTISLNGNTPVSSTESFDDIDAIELDAETEGDVTLHINDGTEVSPTVGDELSKLRGGLYYSNDDQSLEGDLGVPVLGSGSHATEIGTTYEHFLGDSVQRNSEDIAFDLNDVTFEIDNGFDVTAREDSTRYRITEGNREVAFNATVVGHRASHRHIMDSLGSVGADIVWTMSKTELTVNGATVTGAPERTRESDQAAAQPEVEFMGQGDPALTVTTTS